MTRLEHCLGKVSKLIDKADADLLRKQSASYEAEGMKPVKAATAAARLALDAVNKDYASTLKATRKISPKTVPLLEAYWKGEPLSVSELPKAHVKLAQQLMEAGVNSEAELSKVLKGESTVWVKPFAEWMLKNKVEPPVAPEPVVKKPEPTPTPEVKAEPVAKKPAPKLPPKIQKPDLVGARRKITDETRKRNNLEQAGLFVGVTDQDAVDEALGDIAENDNYNNTTPEKQKSLPKPPRVGEDLVNHLTDNPDSAVDKIGTALLIHESIRAEKALETLRNKIESSDNPTQADINEKERAADYLRTVLDLMRRRGSQAGLALQAQKLVTDRQFNREIMLSDFHSWQNQGKEKKDWQPVSKEDEARIVAESARVKELIAKLEKEEAAHKASIAKQEQLQQENLQLKRELAAAKKPRKAPERKSTSESQARRGQSAREKLMTFSVTFKTTGKGPSTLDRMADNARQRIKARSSRTSAGVDPVVLLDVTIIAAQYIKNGITKLADVTARLVKDFGEDYRKYAKPAFDKANENINSTADESSILEALTDIAADYSLNGLNDEQIKEKILEEFGDTFKSLLDAVVEGIKPRITKTAAGSRKKSPQELASLIDPSEKLSRQMVYNMAGGLLPKFRGDALINEILRLIQPSLPHVTFNDVVDAYTGYGKAKFPNKEELATLQRKERRLQLLNRQIGVVRQGQLPELTGLQQDRLDPNNEDDQKIRHMIAERNQLMKDLKLTEDSAKRNQMRGTLSAIKTRYRNDLTELENAIKTRTALVEKKKQDPQTDQELTELKAQKKAKRVEYNAAFGINTRQLSLEQRLKAADKALDKSLALEEKMELEGILKRPTKPGLPQTVEMKAKAAQIKAKRDARHAETRRLAREARELLNPPKTEGQRHTAALEKQVQRSIDRFEYFLKHGKLPPTEGEPTTFDRTTFPTELFKIKAELAAAVAVLRADKRKLNALQKVKKNRAIIQLESLRDALEKQINNKSWGKPVTEKPSDPRVVSLKESIKILQSIKERTQKLDPSWVASYEAKLNDALIKASRARTSKWEQRLRDGDFSDPTKIKREPSKELIRTRFEEQEAKQNWLKERQRQNLKAAPLWERVSHHVGALTELRKIIFLGLDLTLGRQGLIGLLTRPITTTKSWFKALANLREEQEAAEWERLHDPARTPAATYFNHSKQWKLFGPFEEGYRNKEDMPDPELLNRLNRYLGRVTGKGRVSKFAQAPVNGLLLLERINRMHNNYNAVSMLDALIKTAPEGKPTKKEVEVFVNAVMNAMGRGSFKNPSLDTGVQLMNHLLISTRYLISGLNIAVGQPLLTTRGGYSGTGKARLAVAWHIYGKTLISASTIMTVLGYIVFGDDEEKWKAYINPKSNRFGVVPWNGVDYEPLKRLTPYISILVKTAPYIGGDKIVNGKIVPLRGEGSGKYKGSLGDEWFNFVNNRKNINLALAAEIITWKQFDGSAPTVGSIGLKAVGNLNILNDIKVLQKEQMGGIQKGFTIAATHAGFSANLEREKKPTNPSPKAKIKIKPLNKQ